MQSTPPITPARQDLINYLIFLIMNLGIQDEKVFIASTILNNYVLSFVLDETTFKSLPKVTNNDFSIFRIHMSLKNLNLDKEFLNGLYIILDGIEKQDIHKIY